MNDQNSNKRPDPEPDGNRIITIQKCAYGLYRKRGSAPGGELDDWLEAEKIVSSQKREQTAATSPLNFKAFRPGRAS